MGFGFVRRQGSPPIYLPRLWARRHSARWQSRRNRARDGAHAAQQRFRRRGDPGCRRDGANHCAGCGGYAAAADALGRGPAAAACDGWPDHWRRYFPDPRRDLLDLGWWQWPARVSAWHVLWRRTLGWWWRRGLRRRRVWRRRRFWW